MTRINLRDAQREQMAALLGQLSTTRTVAEAFVGYFAKELGVNLQLYQFNADTLAFEPVQGYAPVQQEPESMPPAVSTLATRAADTSENGKVEAI